MNVYILCVYSHVYYVKHYKYFRLTVQCISAEMQKKHYLHTGKKDYLHAGLQSDVQMRRFYVKQQQKHRHTDDCKCFIKTIILCL